MMISSTSTLGSFWWTASARTALSFAILACFAFAHSFAHYNQPQYGVPQQQQQQVYHQQVPAQGQPVQYQQVPVQQGQQVHYQVPAQQQQQVMYQQHPGQQQMMMPQGEVPHYQQAPAAGQNVLHDASRIHDKEHMKEHLHESLGDQDVNKLSEEELQFHYFKMHDNDNNNMLDGSELIKSLIHWHVEESKHQEQQNQQQAQNQQAPHHPGTTKVFTDAELEQMIDPILQMDDKNNDGFIDYAEFISAQKNRGF